MSDIINGSTDTQSTIAKNAWDDMEVTESTSSFGEEPVKTETNIDDKKETDSSTVKPSENKEVELKTDKPIKANTKAEERIKELTRMRKSAEERAAKIEAEFEEYKKKSGVKVSRNNFNSDEEYDAFIESKSANKVNEILNQRDLIATRNELDGIKQEEFNVSWNARVENNFKTPEELIEFGNFVREKSSLINKARPEIHSYIQHSQNGPLLLQTIFNNEDILEELHRRPAELVFTALNNLESNVLAYNERIKRQGKASNAAAPVGKIDNKTDIVSSSDDLPEDQWYENYFKNKKKSR